MKSIRRAVSPFAPVARIRSVATEAARTWSIDITSERPSETRLERLAEWYEAEHDGLVRFAYLLTRDRSSAEDLVQDAFVRLYRSSGRIEEASFHAYARKTVINLARSWFRHRAYERHARSADAIVSGHADGVAASVDLRRALLSLSVSDRACIALRYFEGLSDVEIAEALGVSAAAAKKRTWRALQRIRERMTEESP